MMSFTCAIVFIGSASTVNLAPFNVFTVICMVLFSLYPSYRPKSSFSIFLGPSRSDKLFTWLILKSKLNPRDREGIVSEVAKTVPFQCIKFWSRDTQTFLFNTNKIFVWPFSLGSSYNNVRAYELLSTTQESPSMRLDFLSTC